MQPYSPDPPLDVEVVWSSVDFSALPCRAAAPDLFFADSPQDLEVAKGVCAPCPVREACLAGALQRREPWGVWGGELFSGGVVIARKRPRGRPRKDAAAVPEAAPEIAPVAA